MALDTAVERLINTVSSVLEKKFLSNGHDSRTAVALDAPVAAVEQKPEWIMPERPAVAAKSKPAAAKPAVKPEPVAPPLPQAAPVSFDPMAAMLDDSDATSAALTIEEVKAEIDRCYSLKTTEAEQKKFGEGFMAAMKPLNSTKLKDVHPDKYAELLAVVASL